MSYQKYTQSKMKCSSIFKVTLDDLKFEQISLLEK